MRTALVRMRLPRAWLAGLFACALVVASPAAVAQQDDPSVKDHPTIPRFPGTVIANGRHNDFGGHDFEVGAGKTQRVEGRFWQIEYAVKEGAKVPGPLEVVRNYGNQFRKNGGSVLQEAADAGGGQATMKMPSPSGELWLEVAINNSGEQLVFTIVSAAPMVQKVQLSADDIGRALAAAGRIAIYGILFDTGKDAIKPQSEPVLSEIAKLLQRDASLRLRIEGHTDNVGAKPDNLALSKRRAESVRRWLAGKGIAEARLEAAGFGDAKPVAGNDSEDGRAKNRRVELARK